MPNLDTRIATVVNFDIFLNENIFCQFKTAMKKQKLILWLAHSTLRVRKFIIMWKSTRVYINETWENFVFFVVAK